MFKIISMMVYFIFIIIGLSGCTSSTVNKNDTTTNVPYSIFEKGVVIDSQKVLVDGSYETILNSTYEKRSGEVTLFKTIVYYKDKNYYLFLNKEIKAGSYIEFIFKNNEMTNITLP